MSSLNSGKSTKEVGKRTQTYHILSYLALHLVSAFSRYIILLVIYSAEVVRLSL